MYKEANWETAVPVFDSYWSKAIRKINWELFAQELSTSIENPKGTVDKRRSIGDQNQQMISENAAMSSVS